MELRSFYLFVCNIQICVVYWIIFEVIFWPVSSQPLDIAVYVSDATVSMCSNRISTNGSFSIPFKWQRYAELPHHFSNFATDNTILNVIRGFYVVRSRFHSGFWRFFFNCQRSNCNCSEFFNNRILENAKNAPNDSIIWENHWEK